MSPFDASMLELYHMYKDTHAAISNAGATAGAPEAETMQQKAVNILFSLLDYPQWQEKSCVWQALAGELEQGDRCVAFRNDVVCVQ